MRRCFVGTLSPGNKFVFEKQRPAWDRRSNLYLSARPRERISRRICHVDAWRNDQCRESVAVSDVTNVRFSPLWNVERGWKKKKKKKKKKICRAYFRTFDHRSWKYLVTVLDICLTFLVQLLVNWFFSSRSVVWFSSNYYASQINDFYSLCLLNFVPFIFTIQLKRKDGKFLQSTVYRSSCCNIQVERGNVISFTDKQFKTRIKLKKTSRHPPSVVLQF